MSRWYTSPSVAQRWMARHAGPLQIALACLAAVSGALLVINVQSDGWHRNAVSPLLSAIVFLLSVVSVRGVARYVADHDRQHEQDG